MMTKMLFPFALALSLLLQTHAHTIIVPALGVNGTATRNDVQRPSKKSMCGKININNTLASSIPVIAQSDGTFVVNVTNFNQGQDGSRQVTAAVDVTAIGQNFTTATVTQNGDLAPSSVGSQNVTVQLPSGTKCQGGPSGNLCLVSFKTAGGFGNCAVVQQGSETSSQGATPESTSTNRTNTPSSTSTPNNTNTNSTSSNSKYSSASSNNDASDGSLYRSRAMVDVRARGTRAARTFRRLHRI